ncbi:MAG: hypothetical protein AAF488_03895 [Planctomycetota bacterium]
MTFRLLFLLMAVVVAGTAHADDPADSAKKSDLRVLLVGHDPAKPRMPFADRSERTVELYKERTAAWEKFLRSRFEHVQVVHGPDYNVSLSEDVDVTVFDCRPKHLTPTKREVDPKTGVMDYQPATYLPIEFDRPAITISENSPVIGEPLGLKLDWL